jgi:hypothetical protein
MSIMDARTQVIVVGYAKLPSNSTARPTHELFSVSLLIEPPSSTVIAVDSTAATTMAQNWLASLLVGADLETDERPYLETVDSHYLGHAAGTIKQAIRDAWRRYAARPKGK